MSVPSPSDVVASEQLAVLSGYSRRLLSPPLPGDGLLVVGFVEGAIGWSLSWLLMLAPSITPFSFLESVVVLWIGLTTAIVAVGTVYTAPTVRRNRIWLVWAGLNASAVSVNIAAVLGIFPGPVQGTPIVADLLGYGYWRPWFLALGIGYFATAFYNWSNPQLRRNERAVYALGGVACLAVLSPWPSLPSLAGAELFLLGGLVHTIPMGFDVIADIALIIRQTG